MKTRINRNDVYVSPLVFIELFNETRDEVGDVELFTSRKYKVLREAWIASMYSITLSVGTHEKMGTGKVWWLMPNPEDVAPDFFAFNTRAIEGKGYLEGINARWEVFEWGERSNYQFIEAVLRKVNRLQDDKMSVIGYAARGGEILDFTSLHTVLSAAKPNILEVWILANTQERQASYVLTQVYPHHYSVRVPNQIPSYFKEPYAFMSKYRGMSVKAGGLMSINEKMEISIVKDVPSNISDS